MAALEEIEATLAATKWKKWISAICSIPNEKSPVLGIGLAVFQQWCGINVIFNYAEEIFRAAGYDISTVLKNIAWTGSVNLAFTFVALGTVDRSGRRPLMLFGAAGLAIIYAALACCYHGGVQGLPMLLLVLAAIALLLDVARARDLGGHLGNFSQPHPRRGDGRRRGRAVAGLLHPDLHVSDFERQTRPGGNVLALRRDLRLWIYFHLEKIAGKQGTNTGTNRN